MSITEDDLPPLDAALPTFAVLARFRRLAPSAEQAQQVLRNDLTGTGYDDVSVERADDGGWLLRARFLVVSIDGHTAVVGVSEALAGTAVDEVWLDRQLP